jgi:glycine/D-amino acid oxidase-like deaminating enzyme
MTTSHWRRNPRPSVIDCDIVVVGAGVCGVSAAIHLNRRGARVTVIDRGAVGNGASQRNAGFLMRGAADNYAAAVRQYGRDRARALWRWTEENLAGLREQGIEALPSYRRVPSCLLALTPQELGEVGESLALLREDGFSVQWMARGTDSAWRPGSGALGGLVNPDDGSCNPHELMGMLSSKLAEPVMEHQEVFFLRAAGSGLEVATPDFTVRARRVLVCTNAYAPLLLPQLAGVITPRRGQMLAGRASGVRLDCSYYANHGSEYIRQAADGSIVVGGWRTYHADAEVGYEDRVTEPVQTGIEGFAARLLGKSLEVTARWSGVMGFSPDGLPIIAPVPGDWKPDSVWFCGGFTGHGMSMAFRTADAAVAAILDGEPVPAHISGLGTGGQP